MNLSLSYQAIFICGDGNVNKNNKNRALIFNQFLKHFSLTHVDIQHNTYHHFLGDGLYDSDIDVILHTPVAGISECVTGIRCKLIHTDMLSHHDMVMSRCTVPPSTTRLISNEKLVTAPRLQNNRVKITWSTDGTVQYMNLITPILKSLRETWLHSCSTSSMSILLQMTNHVMINVASATNTASSLGTKPVARKARNPKPIRLHFFFYKNIWQ